jgi:hypothetical protein
MSATHDHVVQFYGTDERRLIDNVAAFLVDGLQRGHGVLIVAEPAHAASIEQKLHDLFGQELVPDRATVLDAASVLGDIMADGLPSSVRFDEAVGTRVRALEQRFGHCRAYGEMVGRLWAERQASAAIALEQLWNKLLRSVSCELFCGYRIDVLSPDFQIASVDALLSSHTRLEPATAEGFSFAIERAMDDVLGPAFSGRQLEAANQPRSWAVMPRAERMILWLRNNAPRQTDEIIEKARAYVR